MRIGSIEKIIAFICIGGLLLSFNDRRSGTHLSDNLYIDTNRILSKEIDRSNPLNLLCLNGTLTNSIIHSKGVELKAPKNSFQSFDMDKDGNIFYSQIGIVNGYSAGRSKAYEMYIFRGLPHAPVENEYMTLKYFGHTSNIAIEEDNGDVYVWLSSNASRRSKGGYYDNLSVSRIKYEPGKVYKNGYGGDNFFLPGKSNLHPALDLDNDLLCINANSGSKRYFYVYRLSEVFRLPIEAFEIQVKIGGLKKGTEERLVTKEVPGRDLSKLIPLGQFSLRRGRDKKKDINYYPLQGFDIDDSFIYFNEGMGYDLSISRDKSEGYITVLDFQGNIVVNRTKFNAIDNPEDLVNHGLTNYSGYMEAQGIKVKGNQLYLGYASRNGSDDVKRANIFKIDCHRE